MADEKRQEITSKLNDLYTPAGFEIYPFKIGWYNDEVDTPFKFDLHPDTLAYLLVSTPDTFENALVPFMCREDCDGSLDLLDKCMKHYFGLSRKLFPDEDIELIHDFEMTPSRRPKILVQPASHVAGAAYYYTRKALDPDPFDEKKKIFGVCIHPKYGGWFALRGVIIFKSLQSPGLDRPTPIDCIQDNAKKIELLEQFNYHWQDWKFRDIIQPAKRYSEDQKKYFATLPKDRKPLIKELREKYLQKHGSTDSAENGNSHDVASEGNSNGSCKESKKTGENTMMEFY